MAPTDKQIRMMHIVNLMSIAFADGEVSEDEHDVLVNIAQSLSLTEEEFGQCIEHWKQTDEDDIPIAVPETDEEQIEYLKHFTLVMMVDGEIDEREKEFLAFMADQYGFDPEEVVPALMEEVYREFFADDGDEEDDGEGEEDEDPLFEDVDDESGLEMGKIYLEERNVEQAFDELFLPALRNAKACDYFLIIANTDDRLYRLSAEQLEVVGEVAGQGYPLALYLLGRYHWVVRPEADSVEKARQLFFDAADAGIADARWAMARMYLLGSGEQVDFDQYNKFVEQAFDGGSMQAFKQHLHDIIHGHYGNEADPKNAIKVIESFLGKDEEYAAIYPDLYDLLGDAYRKVGNKEKADSCYEAARDHGYYESGAHRFENKVEGPDRDFYRETLSVFLDFACDDRDPDAFLARALEHAYHYDREEGEERKVELLRQLHEDLGTALELGSADAAYYMGLYHYTGAYGYDKDAREAWNWFCKGQERESALAYEGIVQMIDDGIHPKNMPENYREHCLRCAEIRRGGEVRPAAIPTVFIVSPDGKATIYRLEKEEWYKLAHIIGAKRIAPVRVEALDKLGKKAGFDDHLVAWIDIDASRKGLPQNKVAKSFYPGVIAGDVVFSLADPIYDPMPFYGLDEAERAIEVLKAKLDGVVTDISDVSDDKQRDFDYSKVNPFADQGYTARIEPDGKAYIVESGLEVFSLFEEEIYDPARLKKLHDLGKELGLKGRLTLWTDNSALRKQLVMYNKITENPIGAKHYPGPVADNIYVALEDEDYRMMLFDDPEQLKQVCLALGVKPKDCKRG